ncbi:hypothetical protein [Gordonia sp. CPCC 205333]|uniref:hypothetical protein n=1 Tax=Gordonia sp. CPCC 205333 TaxID=3140790 RepID=UPI003AF3FA37
MSVWIDAERVVTIARTYQDQATSLLAVATRLRGDRVGEWGVDAEIAAFGASFARLAAQAADELERYASTAEGLSNRLSSGAKRLVDADLSWGN